MQQVSRLFDRLDRGELALGAIQITQGPEWPEILGYVGFDFFCVDFMVTAIDWSQAADMFRAGSRYGLTPWLRLQSYPWATTLPDGRLPADVLRAIAIGAEGVLASVNTAEQVEALLHPARDAHRRVWVHQNARDRSVSEVYEDSLQRPPLVFPVIESLEAARRVDEILAVPGLRAIFLGMGDLSRALGHPMQDTHPEIRAFVKGVVDRAARAGVMVFANALAYLRDDAPVTDLVDRIVWMWESGIRAIWIPRQPFVAQKFYESTFRTLDGRLASAHPPLRSVPKD